MLKTALQPRWIAALLLALAISTVFVVLSQWQFSTAESDLPPSTDRTETVRPLTEVFTPGIELLGTTADQMVSMTGSFRTEDTVLVENRLYDGEQGYWVVTAFAVDGAPDDAVMPVVRGWVAETEDAVPAPAGESAVVGRLLPPEAPIAQPVEDGILPSLASSELINVWDTPGYSAFVTADEITVNGEAADTGNMRVVDIQAQPQETSVNWMNVFYAIEWVVFAGFSVFLWWRLVADAHARSLEDEDDDEYYYDDDYDDDDDTNNGSDGPQAGRPVPNSEVQQ
ncbi:SURF1 family protein [Arthrobacter sp. ATA002]|uniref:SURF1 family protein n=1 Tax=Arthrobacter sp. ATA002 TaxID=2991715 RepID=UPI0022A759FB|nr:SURF1 family protein [Arthrobacter sp. ATA002]WAP52612.1 SURF1 family protein [Arthrobacter sp. ATA002]